MQFIGGIWHINNALRAVRRKLNLAARVWRHDLSNGRSLTWLATAPLIAIPSVRETAKPYPLNWDEQKHLISHLPRHLADMVLLKVNTGTSDFLFIIPGYIWSNDLAAAGECTVGLGSPIAIDR